MYSSKLNRTIEVHAYLAGPDVFSPNAIEIGVEKKGKLAEEGIIGHYPFDNEIPAELFNDPRVAARAIADGNEQMMIDCCKEGRIGIILANMAPFHGPSTDIGTGYEMGFMGALAYWNHVIIIGYTDNTLKFEDRVIDRVHGGRANITVRDGRMCAPDGTMLEAFGGADNLMLVNAIEKTGGSVVYSFDEAVSLAKTLSDQKLQELTSPERFKIAREREISK